MANLGKIVKEYGRQMKPEGIAIYVYVNSNPGATCAEVAEAIGMGIAALIRHSRRMEGLGFLQRSTEITEKGLHLPASLTTLDPLQNSGGESDKLPLRNEPPTEVIPPPIREGIQNEGVHFKGVSLSDPLQNSGGESGTPIAPSLAKELLNITGAKAPSPRASVKPEIFPLPDWLPAEAWVEWQTYLRERRKPLTASTAKKQIKKLDAFRARGMPPERVIEQAIEHGWQGFYELKEAEHDNGNRRAKQTSGRHDAPQRSPRPDTKPDSQWRFKNSAGG
jgi:hypothetical protein